MTLSHFRQKLFVSLVLLPFFQEWVNDHGEIETDQKSPHGVSLWRNPMWPDDRGLGDGYALWKHEPAQRATAHYPDVEKSFIPGCG
jgi:hypothetical protein